MNWRKVKEANVLKKGPVFQRALEKLERLSSGPATRKAYETSINEYRDHLAVLASAEKKGRKEEKLQIAAKMLKRGRPLDEIIEDAGLSAKNAKPCWILRSALPNRKASARTIEVNSFNF